MGTSASSAGPGARTPLVPSWVDPLPAVPAEPTELTPPTEKPVLPHQPGHAAPLTPAQKPETPLSPLPIEAPADPERFRSPRTNFTGYTRSRAGLGLSRAIRQYVTQSSGGTRTAALRMGIPRRTAANILGFAQQVAESGSDKALQKLGLDRFLGRPLDEAFPELIDVLCADDGGSIDEGIARSSLADAFAEVSEASLGEEKKLTISDLQELLINFVAQSIRHRILNDIGTKAISLPEKITDIESLQKEVYDLIKGSVRDAVGTRLGKLGSFTQAQLDAEAHQIYEVAHQVIVSRTEE